MTPLEYAEQFAAATGGCDPSERFIFCGFCADPSADNDGRIWRPHPWRPGEQWPINPARTNGYLAIATFGRAADGSWRRRNDLFMSGRAVMVDDVGTKVPYSAAAAVLPTVRIETSPGNEQWVYWLGEPETDQVRFSATIDAFVHQRLMANDPGMRGANRVSRVPGHLNTKAKYGGKFRVRVIDFDPAALFTLDDLIDGFGLRLRQPPTPVAVPEDARRERVELWRGVMGLLDAAGAFLKPTANRAGWRDVICPWAHEHTARARTGAAVAAPSPENEWNGAFRCHHGSCADRGWGDFVDVVLEGALGEDAA